jgi:hypothetical protein
MSKTLDTSNYLSLETFRKTGVGVATPVWFAPLDGKLYVFSAGDAGKVKRLRNSSKARVAPCDVRGKVLGEWQDAQAFLVDDPAEVKTAHAALVARYGWQMRLLDCGAKLAGRYDKRAFIRIETGSRKKRGQG